MDHIDKTFDALEALIPRLSPHYLAMVTAELQAVADDLRAFLAKRADVT
jgi:hypothetical protein